MARQKHAQKKKCPSDKSGAYVVLDGTGKIRLGRAPGRIIRDLASTVMISVRDVVYAWYRIRKVNSNDNALKYVPYNHFSAFARKTHNTKVIRGLAGGNCCGEQRFFWSNSNAVL